MVSAHMLTEADERGLTLSSGDTIASAGDGKFPILQTYIILRRVQTG